jgi:hypothetical protein
MLIFIRVSQIRNKLLSLLNANKYLYISLSF